MSPPKSTPMIKQYLSIKGQYPDAILFYRMGDFYEMFFEDAQVASRILEITLTSRNKNVDSPVPMCGVPHRAARSYIARLIDNGYKVAVCDQIEDPSKAKGLVKRDVVRVITPGMVIENELAELKNEINSLKGIEPEAEEEAAEPGFTMDATQKISHENIGGGPEEKTGEFSINHTASNSAEEVEDKSNKEKH